MSIDWKKRTPGPVPFDLRDDDTWLARNFMNEVGYSCNLLVDNMSHCATAKCKHGAGFHIVAFNKDGTNRTSKVYCRNCVKTWIESKRQWRQWRKKHI